MRDEQRKKSLEKGMEMGRRVSEVSVFLSMKKRGKERVYGGRDGRGKGGEIAEMGREQERRKKTYRESKLDKHLI